MYKGGVGVKGELSWESWWEEEQVCPIFCVLTYYRILCWLVFFNNICVPLQAHIQTLRGRILETILSLRFFMFQYGIVYKLNLTGKNTSLAVMLAFYLVSSFENCFAFAWS